MRSERKMRVFAFFVGIFIVQCSGASMWQNNFDSDDLELLRGINGFEDALQRQYYEEELSKMSTNEILDILAQQGLEELQEEKIPVADFQPVEKQVKVKEAALDTPNTKVYAEVRESEPLLEEKRFQEYGIRKMGQSRISLMMIVFACTGAAIFGVVAATTFYKKVRSRGNNGDSEYPAYGVTGPIKPSSLDLVGDRKLAKSAETYHYQNQKRQMLSSERDLKADDSDSDLDDGSECGDYTVYECPGLAPAGCMEVQNPLFIGSDHDSVNTPSPVGPRPKASR